MALTAPAVIYRVMGLKPEDEREKPRLPEHPFLMRSGSTVQPSHHTRGGCIVNHDVLILGYGPVGATAAALLARYGLRIAVVEQSQLSTLTSRARSVSTMRSCVSFKNLGVAREIEKFIAPHTGHDYLGVDGRVIRILDPMEPPYPLGWWPTITFVQPELDAVLRAGVAQHQRVECPSRTSSRRIERTVPVSISLFGQRSRNRAKS